MTGVWDRSGALEAWMRPILGVDRGFGASIGLAAVDGTGRICGGALFHGYWPEHGTIEITIAGHPGFLTRSIASEAMSYAFGFARMLVARTGESNRRARRLWRALGGSETPVPGLWGPDEAEIVLTLTQDQWRESRLYR